MVVGRMMPPTPSPHSANILLLLKLSFPDYRGKGKSMLYMERGKQIKYCIRAHFTGNPLCMNEVFLEFDH